MKAVSAIRGSHHPELFAFAEFYGSALVCAFVLYQLLAGVLPVSVVGGHEQFLGLLSFLIGCSLSSWWFEHHRRAHHD